MKTIILCLSFFAIISCGSRDTFELIDPSKVDQQKAAFSKQLALKIMEGQRSGQYHILTDDEAEKEMSDGFNGDFQKSAYEEIKKECGDFDSLQFVEAWRQTNGDHLMIYRFKSYFNASKEFPEIRVVLSQKGKLDGFFIKPWSKSL